MKRLCEITLACALIGAAAHAQTTLDLSSPRAHGVLPTTKGGTGYNAASLAALKTYLGIGAAGAAAWGQVTGDISTQNDLVGLLGGKAATGGSNATGTWPIGITGNAATATTARGLSIPGVPELLWDTGNSRWDFSDATVTAGAFVSDSFVGGGQDITDIKPSALTGAGQVPVAALGTGTPSASTVLLGSGAWGAVPAAALPANVALTDAANTFTAGVEINRTGTATVGDLSVAGTSTPTLYIGRQSPTSGDNTQLVFRDRVGGVKSSWSLASTGSITFTMGGNTAYFGIGAASPSATLHVKGMRPDAVAGNGTASAPTLLVEGAAGGASTGTTGQTGGAGASITLTGGAGGAVAGAGGIGGAGGNISLTPGAGGAGGATNGAVGKIVFAIANVVNAANDAAAATAGVPVGGIYRNGSVLMIRVS